MTTIPERVRPRTARRRGASVPEFSAGGDFTLGAEEELLLVHRSGRLRPAGAEQLVSALSRCPSSAGTVGPEIFANQLELNTCVCPDGDALARSLAQLREALRRAGARLMAAGVHPAACFGEIQPVSSPRYDAIVAEFGGLFRTPTSSLQVHVGLPDADSAIAAYRGLRNRLPLLRGLAAASPYWHGRDSGLASARSAIMWSYPRVGVPPAVHSYGEYVERTSLVMAAAEVPDYTYLWWDLRPQPRLGTLEVRVMDAQPSLRRVAGLAALVQGLARSAVERPVSEDLPSEVLAEDDFRATRYGLDARISDADGRMWPLRTLAERALRQARAALRGDGLEAALDAVAEMLAAPSEAARQRAIVADGGLAALLHDLTERSTPTDVRR